jgi:hypothetical protein
VGFFFLLKVIDVDIDGCHSIGLVQGGEPIGKWTGVIEMIVVVLFSKWLITVSLTFVSLIWFLSEKALLD